MNCRRSVAVLAVTAVTLTLMPLSGSVADVPPSEGWAFDVRPLGPELYGIQEPWENPVLQRRWVDGSGDVELFVETWLPKEKDGRVPPAKMPTVLVMSPYAMLGRIPNSSFNLLDEAVTRGYAYSVMHVRGTGESGGCFDVHGPIETDDGVRVIDHIAHAEWSDGTLGLIGLSAPGGTALMVAASDHPQVAASVKALVVGAPADVYQHTHFDGIPPYVNTPEWFNYLGYGYTPETSALDPINWGSPWEDFVLRRLEPGGVTTSQHASERPGCIPSNAAEESDDTGDVTAWYVERTPGRVAHKIGAPTFMYQGFQDHAVPASTQAGLFDRIRAPKTGLFGVFGHETPDRHPSIEPDWERIDFKPMAMAWLDRWVRGIDTGVERWPVAQVQSNEGQWRAEGDWPTTGGPAGHLALGQGTLGSTAPSGSSSFTETQNFDSSAPVQAPGTLVVFRSGPLPDRLHLSGQPMLDAWLVLDKDDAHIGVELHAYDADGRLMPHTSVSGFRSMRHRESFNDGLFLQSEGTPAPVGKPFRVTIRLRPTDIVVPQGGHLELRIAGTARWAAGIPLFEHPSRPSGRHTTVTVMHDCEHTSALRFLTARKRPDYMNVREKHEADTHLAASHGLAPSSDAGGLATQPVCGRAAERVQPTLGEAFDYQWNPHSGGKRLKS